MKKLLLFISALFLNLTISMAQAWVYHPFPTDSATWSNRVGLVDPGSPPGCCSTTVAWASPVYYCMSNTDTMIGAFTYSKLNYCGGAYKGALRDAGRKIYFIPADSVNELLIYDFTVTAGSTVSTYCTPGGNGPYWIESTYTVGPVDSVQIAGSYRKRINMGYGYWIEGIGNTMGLFFENWPNVSMYTSELMCMSEGNTTLYPSYSIGPCSLSVGVKEEEEPDHTLIYPNPGMGKFQISSNKKIITIEVSDMLGRIIYRSEVNGIFSEIDLSAFPANIYFVKLTDAKKSYAVKKIVKE